MSVPESPVPGATVPRPAPPPPAPAAQAAPAAPAAARTAPAGLELRGLRKAYGPVLAVDGVDLTVPAGSFFGLVGPNGAGKTTLLSMAVGLLAPDAGEASVLGHPVWGRSGAVAAKEALGVLPSGLALPPRLTGRELLTYLGLLRRLPAAVVDARATELLDVLGLAAAGGMMIADYSTGMVKKIGLAAAVLHGPRVLVLDEPLEAVDPLSAMTISAVLRGFTRGGGTVLMSTHVMALVEQLCDRVAVLARGRVVRSGTLDQVAGQVGLDQAFLDAVGSGPVERELSWFAS
jgi:ABC-2 type transport system ATP-binding protein